MSAALVAITSANSALIAAQNARLAEQDRQQCQAFMPSFEAKAATVEQARYYSHCVGVIYPQPLEGSDLVLGKIAVVILILALIGGVIYGWFDRYDRLPAMFMFGLMFPCIAAAMGLVGFGIVVGLKFVLS